MGGSANFGEYLQSFMISSQISKKRSNSFVCRKSPICLSVTKAIINLSICNFTNKLINFAHHLR